jgi:[citrate (pro-3S)-lyase] ligase
MQRKFNEKYQNENYILINQGIAGIVFAILQQINKFDFQSGDICAVVWGVRNQVGGLLLDDDDIHSLLDVKIHDTQPLFDRPHSMGEIFTDKDGHYTQKACQSIANFAFETMQRDNGLKFIGITNRFSHIKTKKIMPPIKIDYPPETTDFLYAINELKKQCRLPNAETLKIASVVLTANPFTNGHKYLCETSLSVTDYLYVFVLEEDMFFYPFQERFEIVCKNLPTEQNIKILGTKDYLSSSRTFPEYFTKEKMQNQVVNASINADCFIKVCKALNITLRYIGTEPRDFVTAQSLDQYGKTLPKHGIEVRILERKQSENGAPYSAFLFRKLIAEGNYEEAKKIVPEATYEHLLLNKQI